MTDDIPITIIDTLLCTNARHPIAKSHPQAIDTAIRRRFFQLRNDRNNRARISTTASDTDRMLSVFICDALPTAITGPPIT